MNYKKLTVILLVIILVVTGAIVFMKYYNKKIEINITKGERPVTNPLKGWAVWGESSSDNQDVTLAYVVFKWSDLEPQKGVYDFETIENNFNFEQWKSKNARFIIRLICDYPEAEAGNMTIPQWLYDEMGGDGQQYDNNYGIGFAPNYSNEVFIAAHERVIKALGERYNEDPYVAYIQLGSVGHWGEWHVNFGKGINKLPKASILDQYVQPYIDYFSDKMLAIRRPTVIASENNFGLYNDVFGDKDETDIWLDRIANGYTTEQTDEELPGMSDFWKTTVSGGEISSNQPLEYYLGENFEETYRELEESHTTFLGPKSPSAFEKGCEYQENMDKMTADMGYCFTINKVVIENLYKKKDLKVTVSWENLGVAPIYQNWPICISIVGNDGTEYAKETVDSKMTEWVSGTHNVIYKLKDTKKLPIGDYKITISILDPITMKPGIALALDEEMDNLIYTIGEFSK
jgi:hypothetical protein